MFFTQRITSPTVFGPDVDSLISRAKWIARRRVALYKQNTQDKLLDRLLRKEYQTNLIQASLRIIANAKFMTDTLNNSELTIIIPDKQLDKLASLITYGNGNISGSNILRNAFEKEG